MLDYPNDGRLVGWPRCAFATRKKGGVIAFTDYPTITAQHVALQWSPKAFFRGRSVF